MHKTNGQTIAISTSDLTKWTVLIKCYWRKIHMDVWYGVKKIINKSLKRHFKHFVFLIAFEGMSFVINELSNTRSMFISFKDILYKRLLMTFPIHPPSQLYLLNSGLFLKPTHVETKTTCFICLIIIWTCELVNKIN